MSDRTQGSVRSDSPVGDDAVAGTVPGAAPSAASPSAPPSMAPSAPPVTATQSIPTTGGMRVQGATAGSTPASGQPTGAPPRPPEAGASPTTTVRAGNDPDAGPSGGRSSRGPSRTSAGRGPRRARLQLRHIDTWSALKISLVLSIALFFIWMVAVGVLYGVLNALGVFAALNDLFGQIGSASGGGSGGDVVTPGLVFGGAAIIGAINIVLMTALFTVGTSIYNLCSDLVGGLELTLSERD